MQYRGWPRYCANTQIQANLVGRYGGEEFCIALIGRSADACHALAETIRKDAVVKSRVWLNDQDDVTASLGLVHVADCTASVKQLVDRADAALYRAKETGRNKTVIWNEADFVDSEVNEASAVVETNEILKRARTQSAPKDDHAQVGNAGETAPEVGLASHRGKFDKDGDHNASTHVMAVEVQKLHNQATSLASADARIRKAIAKRRILPPLSADRPRPHQQVDRS